MSIIREIVSEKDGTIVSIFQPNSYAFPVYFPAEKTKRTKQKPKVSRSLCWNMFGNDNHYVKPRREDRHAWMRTTPDNHMVSRVGLKRGVDDGVFGRNTIDEIGRLVPRDFPKLLGNYIRIWLRSLVYKFLRPFIYSSANSVLDVAKYSHPCSNSAFMLKEFN